MLEQYDECAVSLETLGSVSHNPIASLPACQLWPSELNLILPWIDGS